ncbi:MAG: TlpA family protein disulfide reductase [Ilumatobacteraceae bacterium]|jgi:thiol-disulfide isomerase/thioredoxin|nr:TlpA family protein disulfide reductase [Ilumatobacteraceae bacterium]
MAQNQRKKKQKTTGASSARDNGNLKVILYIVLVVVGIAGAVSLGTAGGSTDTAVNSGVTVPGGVAAAEFQKVTTTGDGLPQMPESGDDPAVGKAAPSLTGFDLAGRPAKIDPGSDSKATMLVFLAHWCQFCNREIPVLNDWKEQGLVPPNLRVVGVTTGSREDQANWPPSKWLVANKWTFDQFADSEKQEAAAAYGVGGYPFIVFVDAMGNVTSRSSGEVPVEDLTTAANAAAGVKN